MNYSQKFFIQDGDIVYNSDLILKNSQNIKNIKDFVNHKIIGDNNVFVCIIGEDRSYLTDISTMDNTLRKSTAYNRLSALPPLPPDKVNSYEDKYNNWLRSFKRKAVTATTLYNEKQSEILSSALILTMEIFRRSRKQTTDSIEKNFAIKLLFWYDFAAEALHYDSHISNGIKIVGENVQKIQEYLFYYMMSLTGADVMILQNKVDLDTPLKNLNLSGRSVLGHLGNTDIPKFTKIHTQPPMANKGNSGFAPPPPQSNHSTRVSSVPQSSGGIRVNIPPRPNRTSPSPQLDNNIKMNIPPHPGRQSSQKPLTPTQSNKKIKMNIPPHPDRHSDYIQTMKQTSSPPRAATPPRQTPTSPSRSNSVYNYGNNKSTPHSKIEKSYEELAQLASSVVQIFCIKQQNQKSDKFQILGSGSGIMISTNGFILTNFHVAKASHEYIVRIENDDEIYFTNRLIKYHTDYDLAIIQIDRKINPLPIYNGSKPLVRGQKVVAIGSPKGLFNTVSDGIISGFRNIDDVDMIQFTAPISSGSSGGAVLNMYGELIGISTSGIDEGQNINFAVDYKTILNFTRGITSMFSI